MNTSKLTIVILRLASRVEFKDDHCRVASRGLPASSLLVPLSERIGKATRLLGVAVPLSPSGERG
eukprot:6174408-Pleurochrysis_carterae.AAC.2